MFDVNTLATDGHSIKVMKDCVRASVVVSDERVKLGKADANVWGFMHERARNIFVDLNESKVQGKGSNEPEIPVTELAASIFRQECDEAISESVREFRYTEGQLKNFKRYASQLTAALIEGAPLTAKDENGNYTLSGKSKVEKWMRDKKEAEDQAKLKELAAARQHLGLVTKSEAAKAETAPAGSNIFEAIRDEDLRKVVEETVAQVAAIEAKAGADRAVEMLTAFQRRLGGVLGSEIAKVKKAANS